MWKCLKFCWILLVYCTLICAYIVSEKLYFCCRHRRTALENTPPIVLKSSQIPSEPETVQKSAEIFKKLSRKSAENQDFLSHKTAEYDIDTAKRRRFILGIVYIKSTDPIKKFSITISLSIIRKKFIFPICILSHS